MLLDQDFATRQLPRHLKEYTKKDLRDHLKSPYAFAHNMEGKSYYEVISATLERFEMLNKTIAAMGAQMPVLGMFPISSLKQQVEAEPDRAFIVDVGSGLERPLMSIQEKRPPHLERR